MKQHTEGKWKCKICNIKFSASSLSWHNRRMHGANTKKLGSKFAKLGTKIAEVGTNAAERKCKKCDARFASRNNLGKINVELRSLYETKNEIQNFSQT